MSIHDLCNYFEKVTFIQPLNYDITTACKFRLLMFRSSHFSFLVFGHFWGQSYENTKILRNLCLHFARQDRQDGKKTERKSHNLSDQNTKNPKTKIWDEGNNSIKT